jgi:transcriptional regulator with XRE-family HTH domain
MSEWEEFLDEQLKDPEVCAEWDALEPEFAIVQAIIDARKSVGLTQKQLSERTGIAQSDISKLESGDGNPSLRTLKRLALAMDMTLKIEFLRRSSERQFLEGHVN